MSGSRSVNRKSASEIMACLLPVAIVWTMGGHSMIFCTVYGLPVGSTAGLWYSDFRRHYVPVAGLLRSVVGLLLEVLMILVLSKIGFSPFWSNHGWVLIPLCVPFVAAVVSGLILTTHVKPQT